MIKRFAILALNTLTLIGCSKSRDTHCSFTIRNNTNNTLTAIYKHTVEETRYFEIPSDDYYSVFHRYTYTDNESLNDEYAQEFLTNLSVMIINNLDTIKMDTSYYYRLDLWEKYVSYDLGDVYVNYKLPVDKEMFQ